jgi:hypothetical protein
MSVLFSEFWNACALPWKLVAMVGGTWRVVICFCIAATAVPSGVLPFR